MIQLEQDGLPDESLHASETSSRLTGANYVDKARFDPIPNESRASWEGEEASSGDPIFGYCRSLKQKSMKPEALVN
jgi:hypothetical protein